MISIYNYVIEISKERNIQRSWSNPIFTNIYRSKILSIYSNLKENSYINNKQLLQSIITKEIEVIDGIDLFPGLKSDWVWMSFVIVGNQKKIEQIKNAMKSSGIESRSWWGKLCSDYDAFEQFPKTVLPTSKKIARTHLNLPFHEHLTSNDIEKIFAIMKKV